MKVLFYINTLGGGGAERAISRTATYFAEHGWETILLTSFQIKDEYAYSEKVRRMSIEDNQSMKPFFRRNINRIKLIRKICMAESVDIAVSFLREPNLRVLVATAGFIKTKVVVSVRNDPEIEYAGIFGKLIGKYLLPYADGAVFQTEDAKMWFPKKLQQKSAIIYNIVDESFYKTGYKDGQDIVSCGRIVPAKNHILLVKAFKKVHDVFPKIRLRIYGEIKVDVEILALIEELKLQDSVFLMGRKKDVLAVLARAKLFVLSSDYEGMPNALMEAMAVGVPCISTDCPCGGPRELFGKDLAEMLTPIGDEDALADKIIRLLSDEQKRQEIGRKMQSRAEEFRTDKIGKQWISYIQQVCKR